MWHGEVWYRKIVARKRSLSLGDRWWPQTAKQEGHKISKNFRRNLLNVIEHPKVGRLSIRSRNGAPSRKEFVVNGQKTEGKQQTLSLIHI